MKPLASLYAVGARTPFGSNAEETALRIRTGLPALTSAPLASPDGGAVTMGLDPVQDPYVVGEDRAARIAALALSEVSKRLEKPRDL